MIALSENKANPPRRLFLRKAFKILGGSLFILLGFYLLLRPWHTRWNCTNEDLTRVMPGDSVVANPSVVTHRAIRIAAPPSEVWPWLNQMGEGRGGFYSYDWIDHLLGFNINSADRILPQFQAPLKVGDSIPREMYIWAVKPNEYLVVGTPPGFANFQTTWALVLYPTPEGGTKVISRVRAHYDRWTLPNLLIAAVLDPGQFIMEQKQLRNLKVLIERRHLSTGSLPPSGGK